jgi:DNA-binding transcriptional regulator WhiA
MLILLNIAKDKQKLDRQKTGVSRSTAQGLTMRFENTTITQDVTVDYNEFINCEFQNCKFIYHGGSFYISNCKFTNVQYVLAGQAHDTLTYLRFLKNLNPELLEQLLSEKASVPAVPGKGLN